MKKIKYWLDLEDEWNKTGNLTKEDLEWRSKQSIRPSFAAALIVNGITFVGYLIYSYLIK